MIASGFQVGREGCEDLRLTSSFSIAASMTRSAIGERLKLFAGAIRLSAGLALSSLIRLFLTWRAHVAVDGGDAALMRSGRDVVQQHV